MCARSSPGGYARLGLSCCTRRKIEGQLRSIAFRQQLEKIGWTVDGNLQINFKWGTGDADWVRSATEDVLSGKPDVLLGDAAAKAAQRATRTVPIIFIGSGRRSHSSLARRQRDWFTVMEPSLGAKLPGILSRSRHTSPALRPFQTMPTTTELQGYLRLPPWTRSRL